MNEKRPSNKLDKITHFHGNDKDYQQTCELGLFPVKSKGGNGENDRYKTSKSCRGELMVDEWANSSSDCDH